MHFTNCILFALLIPAAVPGVHGESDDDLGDEIGEAQYDDARELHGGFYYWGGNRIPICKLRNNGKFVWKRVKQRRVDHIIANGGGFPGDAVPGHPGYTFGEYCGLVAPNNPPPRVDFCKKKNNGTFKLKNVKASRIPTLINQGGGFPGDDVPGNPGFIFGDDCELLPEATTTVAPPTTTTTSEVTTTTPEVTTTTQDVTTTTPEVTTTTPEVTTTTQDVTTTTPEVTTTTPEVTTTTPEATTTTTANPLPETIGGSFDNFCADTCVRNDVIPTFCNSPSDGPCEFADPLFAGQYSCCQL